jgi:hypothetical protein
MTKTNPDLIFESPDGGHTVYVRSSGSSQRELYHVDNYVKEKVREIKFREILEMAKTDSEMADLVDKLEVLYELKRK